MNKNENPRFFGHRFRLTWNDILVSLACLGLGILLAIFPQIAQETVMIAIGAVCIVIGISYIIRYAMLDIYKAINNDALVYGLVWAVGGILICALRQVLVVLLPVLMGFFVLYCGLIKFDQAIKLLRMKGNRWYLQLINSAFSIIVGVLIICNPFTTAYFLMRFLGIVLAIEGILDFISKYLYIGIHDKFFSAIPTVIVEKSTTTDAPESENNSAEKESDNTAE